MRRRLGHREGMGREGDAGRRRVFVPQALGADEYLRATWHRQRRVIVISHWQGDRCVAATPVRVDEAGELAELLVAALADGVESGAAETPWSPPAPESRVA